MTTLSKAHALLRSIWNEASFWLVGRYVLMPDHLHFFCAPGEKDYQLEKWMGYWKRRVSIRWEPRLSEPVFQRDFFDRQLRSTESYDAKWEYVRMNPVRAGLVLRAEDWPYQGEMNLLRW